MDKARPAKASAGGYLKSGDVTEWSRGADTGMD